MLQDPGLWGSLWQGRLHAYEELARQRLQGVGAEPEQKPASALTARRLRRLSSGLTAQLAALSGHFQQLIPAGTSAPKSAIPLVLPSGIPPVLKCYENLFRDWSWGSAEAEQSLEIVRDLAPRSLGRLAVYGAGAGRLAVDVHTALEPEHTVALDINPFPLLVAARLVRGEEVSLPEFPVGPHSEEGVVVHQTLRAPSLPGPNFVFAFADALRPPFAAGSLDTVLTSWVVDALDADVADTATVINQVLRAGGTWINAGPLRFDGPLAQAYSREEVHQIVEDCGFELLGRFTRSIDYFKSPHSGSHRRESLFCFAARKRTDATPRRIEGVYAGWLLDAHQPVPMTPSGNGLRRNSVFTIGVLSLVDGKRSLTDIAAALGKQWHVAPETLLEPLREFFAKLALR